MFISKTYDRLTIQPLYARAADAKPVVRWEAATALGLLREKSAVAALEPLRKDPDGNVAHAADVALQQINSPPPKNP